ncbi:endonuclease/exonuclease/phosphatase family protein [Enterovibrio sp. ZSDZ42]|uniref:Endonuclease/exonuclease/phosphatase family protein n=1 Tax=Enterovibrio gelatinilyticus TaxID=2899819 RepID=A0ABT5QYC2_9GAMM|nr:endonuclease/exonuclease/phosphatase family protein [Enterovibrio sp. ZSDZ42]MDD1792610.1 endonuclease/exonuclease/phosphatase family protein [Enterovibrio sp. ZSDZ42]
MKQFRPRWVILSALILICGILTVYTFVDVPEEASLASGEGSVRCRGYSANETIDVTRPLNIAVWNIYKQQLDGWEAELSELSKDNAIILLQEAQSKPQLLSYIEREGWHSNQAYAFAIKGEIAGVMTLSEVVPKKVCAYTKIEPYLRLPKSALYSAFSLSNGKTLSVINLHSINFTFGVEEYKEQLHSLVDAVRDIKGPIIIAGDFNTWSEERLDVVKMELEELGLKEAQYSSDDRLTVFGYPLDHLFYRELELVDSRSKNTSASDHAFIEASLIFPSE